MSSRASFLDKLNAQLDDGWEAKLQADGRIYYTHHKSQTTSWLPPRENWDNTSGLPYGWETALDRNEKPYYINHVDKYTTREDPRHDPEYVEPPKPREVELYRDPEKGFGFVAGSEKPVVVRFVTEGGPSVDKLLPGDLILRINGEEVRRSPREKVIELVRSCRQSIVLTVSQPYSDNSNRKSAILTAAKKARLKNNPSKVRFADAILVNGASVAQNQSPQESYAPFMPNVLKVFLENGQTKSFKYDSKTTVKDVVCSLQSKLNISSTYHFCLMLQNMKNNVPGQMILLDEQETLDDIAARPEICHFRCLFRVAFVPLDAYDLLKEDPVAFEYFYMQCCNDVVQERLTTDMKYDTALRLAALHIQQHAASNNIVGKISIKAIEKATGLERFVAHSLMESMKNRDLRKMLSQYMKMNQSLTAPGQKQLTALQAKLHYMKIVSELKTFGSRVFMVTLLDQKSEAMVLVGPKAGVSVVTNIKSYTLTQLADFSQIELIKVTKEGENMQCVDIKVNIAGQINTIGLGLLTADAQNFVLMLEGYYHIFVDKNKQVVERTVGKNTSDPDVPTYSDQHRVLRSSWAYPEDLVSEVVGTETNKEGSDDDDKIIDLSKGPPKYQEEGKSDKLDNELHGDTTIVSKEDTLSTSQIARLAAASSVFEEEITSFRGLNTDEGVYTQNSFKYKPQSPISLVTFQASPVGRRGQPLANAKSDSQLNQSPKTDSILKNGTPPNRKYSLGAVGEGSNDSILLDSEASERQALLPDSVSRRTPSPLPFNQHSNPSMSGPWLNGGLDPESDDTDSGGTPGESPAKKRLTNTNLAVQHDHQSFGLHSPDMVPGSSSELHSLQDQKTNSMEEQFNSLYSVDGYTGQRLYYDPDIIDLTNFPPPETPDNDSMLDFTELANCPPPIFSSNSSLPTSSRIDSVNGPKLTGKYSRLERSASIGHCPDFLDDDIDALIAQFTIPPPPSSSTDSRGVSRGDNAMPSNTSQEDLSYLIIPPPPTNTTPLNEDLTVEKWNPPQAKPVSDSKSKPLARHKRSSSLDLHFIQRANEQLETKFRSKSLDANQNNINNSSKPSPPPDLNVTSTQSDLNLSGESPATVSQKLYSLLQSLPNFTPDILSNLNKETPSANSMHQRSSSLDLTAAQADFPFASSGSIRTFNSVVNFSSRSSSLRLKHSSSHNFEPSSKISNVRERSRSETRQETSSNHSSTGSSSDSFASLKAKLKDYRDYLLNRSKSKSSPSTEPGHTLTRLFTRRDSDSDHKVTTSSADSNWELKEAKPTSESSVSVKDKSGVVLKDGLPVVRDALGLHRSSLRPVTSSLLNQSKSKKHGPLKALPSDATKDSGVTANTTGKPPKPSKSTRKTKDDLAMSQMREKLTANPYATIKMWRPVSMSVHVPTNDKVEETYQSFKHLNVLRQGVNGTGESTEWNQQDRATGGLPMTGHIRDKDRLSQDDHWHQASLSEQQYLTRPLNQTNTWISEPSSDLIEIPEDYSRDNSPASVDRLPVVSNGVSDSLKGDIPATSHPRSTPTHPKANGQQPSFQLVSDGVSKAIQQVLSHSYSPGQESLAIQDVETLLEDLKVTMKSLKTSRMEKSSVQLNMCVTELLSQTKQFVQDAKLVVSSTSSHKEKFLSSLQAATHTLAYIFLHSQATMLLVQSADHAEHMGLQLVKAANAFKTTVNAANKAIGKPISDPDMKYLMKQATNLASLLGTLISTIKGIQNETEVHRL